MKLRNRLIATVLIAGCALSGAAPDGCGCTSLVASGRATLSGRPLLWKHRDTSAENNFIARVEADSTSGAMGFTALFNGGDSLLLEAWMGMNDAGFAVMNTASYNLAPDTARIRDREGLVMAAALRCCRSVDDFEALLRELPKPLGVQANFGVIDALGGAAYFETDDHRFTRFDAATDSSGILIRTNYSVSGDSVAGGRGYIRRDNAAQLLADITATASLTPADLTEGVSRSFYHSLLGCDVLGRGDSWAVDTDFVPRDISTASIVIEGILPGEDPSLTMMWAALGYPPAARLEPVFADSIPSGFGPSGPGFTSPACTEATAIRRAAHPLRRGNGPSYINLDILRPIIEARRAEALDAYARGSAARRTRTR